MSTQTLPTDKHNSLYYGPTTWPEVRQLAQNLHDDHQEGSISVAQMQDELAQIEAMLRDAGYTGIANKFRKEWLAA